MNILITGGTGFIGSELVANFKKSGYKIIILTRQKIASKNDTTYIKSINDININSKIDIIINLAGANISKRWTKSYKKTLINSRLKITEDIINFIKRAKNKPKLLISASAIGYYGNKSTNTKEEDFVFSNEFTHILCDKWEKCAKLAEQYGVKVSILRFGVVIGNGGALAKMLPAFKLGLGGKIGSGTQAFSWVHILDVINAIMFIINNNLYGIFNITSPNPTTNQELTSVIAQKLNRPMFFTIPKFAIKILFGEMGEELLLKGNKILPNKLISLGFNFKYPDIKSAIDNTL